MEQFTIKRKVVIEEKVDYNMFIAHKVREHRERVKMTQQSLADKIGLSRASMVNIEQGKQHLTIGNLYLLCKFFGVPSHTFLPF